MRHWEDVLFVCFILSLFLFLTSMLAGAGKHRNGHERRRGRMVHRLLPLSPSATRCLPASRLTVCPHYSLRGFSELMSIWVFFTRMGQHRMGW